jgi:hypothetical protein
MGKFQWYNYEDIGGGVSTENCWSRGRKSEWWCTDTAVAVKEKR